MTAEHQKDHATETVPPQAFARVSSTLRADRDWSTALAAGIGLLLLSSWVIWARVGSISLYETSQSARVETEAASQPVQAPIAGRIAEIHATLGQTVEAGEVLFTLEAGHEHMALTNAQMRLSLAKQEREALVRQIEAEAKALAEVKASALALVREATEHRERIEKWVNAGIESRQSLLRARTEELRLMATMREAEAAAQELHRQRVALDGQIAADTHEIERLELDLSQRSIRAQTTGVVGDLIASQPGSVVAGGQTLATLVPAAEPLRVVAYFTPSSALGRILPGQPATVRLDGFPWTEYGTLKARVGKVASESRDGLVRVELEVDPTSNPRIPLQHGLPGTVEIEVGKTAPIGLIRREVARRVQ